MSLTSEQYENKIKELEKEVEELKKRQTVQMKRQHYGLTWVDVPEAFDKESENKIPVLEEIKEKAISNDDGKPTHILIEGDNYHALQCLNYTHKGKVDVIYIDPPYNTGSDGFKYKDARFLDEYPDGTLVPKDHPLRHSVWLSFMEKRLKLAKSLLTEDGLIFISIDDNEQTNLKMLCDSIFGEDNFFSTICIELTKTQGMKVEAAQNGTIVKNHEYILVYCNNRFQAGTNRKPLFDKAEPYDNHFNLIIDQNGNQISLLDYLVSNEFCREEFENYKISITYENIHLLMRISKKFNDYMLRTISPILYRTSMITSKEVQSLEIKEGEIVAYKKYLLIKNKKGTIEQLQSFYNTLHETDDYVPEYCRTTIRGTLWKGFYSDMMNVAKEGGVEFKNGKKPKRLVKQLLKYTNRDKAIILDFFAGSGTTGHSVLELNLEDGGSRQFILIQSPENNICDKITYTRIHNVLSSMGNSLKYYKTAFVGNHDALNATDDDCVTLAKKAGCLLSLGENTLDEIQSTDFFQIYEDKNTKLSTAIYFTEDLSHFGEFVERVKDVASSHKSVIVYTFSWSSCEDFIYEFEGISNVEIKAIPQPILEIYKSIYQK